jgi:hypothetical protein
MSWLTIDEFLETLVKNKQIKAILEGNWTNLKQYEHDPKLFVQKLNELTTDNYYSWEYELYTLYNEYKLHSLRVWGKQLLYPDISNDDNGVKYDKLIMDINSEDITFYCEKARKWGIHVHDPISDDNLYKHNGTYIYELTGLQGATVSLQQIRNHVHRVDNYGEIVCIE